MNDLKEIKTVAVGISATVAVVTGVFVFSIVFLIPVCIKLMAWSEEFWGLK